MRFHGTDKYASITNHKKTSAVDLSHAALDTLAPGRRDDMESIGYLIVMFLKGDLPWSEKFKDVFCFLIFSCLSFFLTSDSTQISPHCLRENESCDGHQRPHCWLSQYVRFFNITKLSLQAR